MKPKREKKSFMDMLDDATASLGTVVGERWYVEEFRKPWYDSGYYGQGHMPETGHVATSPYFKTEVEAQTYMDRMEARDEDHGLRLRRQKCYERVERRWL